MQPDEQTDAIRAASKIKHLVMFRRIWVLCSGSTCCKAHTLAPPAQIEGIIIMNLSEWSFHLHSVELS